MEAEYSEAAVEVLYILNYTEALSSLRGCILV